VEFFYKGKGKGGYPFGWEITKRSLKLSGGEEVQAFEELKNGWGDLGTS